MSPGIRLGPVTTVEVRPAARADVGGLSRTLGKAFFDDPVMVWMLPDADLRRRKLHHLFASLTRHHHLSRGGVEVALHGDGVGAAALWDPPGEWKHTQGEQLRAVPGLFWAFGRSLRKGLVAEELMKKAHPEEPHWYLAIIGSDPEVRGKGFGQALMSSRLERCDAEYAPAYLESSIRTTFPTTSGSASRSRAS
jgi:GNAT superfamily N-acetyltransferase